MNVPTWFPGHTIPLSLSKSQKTRGNFLGILFAVVVVPKIMRLFALTETSAFPPSVRFIEIPPSTARFGVSFGAELSGAGLGLAAPFVSARFSLSESLTLAPESNELSVLISSELPSNDGCGSELTPAITTMKRTTAQWHLVILI